MQVYSGVMVLGDNNLFVGNGGVDSKWLIFLYKKILRIEHKI